jgi:hypothetical protein
MKPLFAIVMIAFAIVFTSFTSAINPFQVEGKLVIHGHKKMQCTFKIIVKSDEKIAADAKVDSSGQFELRFTPAGEKSFDFFYTDSHHANDTIFLKSYKEFESDKMEVTFYTFKGVRPVDEDDHVICPKCNSSKNVSAVEGLPGYYYCAYDRIKF